MSRFIFAALASLVVTRAAAAQQVPGRDLLEFPLGLLAEAPPLSSRMPASIWNPAVSVLGPNSRGAVGVAGLTTPQDLGVGLRMIAGEYRLASGITTSFSLAQASVADILRTATDPTSLGLEVQYGTTLLSAGAATTRKNLTVGLAARYRWATFDTDHSHSTSLDGGAVMDRVAGTPLRLAVSTFLFSPSRSKEAATYSVAGDIPVLWRDTTFALRTGYSFSHTEGRGRDDYIFATSTYRQFDASAGVSQATAYGHTTQRVRLGAGLRYTEYTVAVGRENGAAGFGASYQFLLTRVIR